MKNLRVLVTGGAGFIGSHLVDRLGLEGAREIIVIDNLSLGKEGNLDPARAAYGDRIKFVEGDASDLELVTQTVGFEPVDIFFDLAVVPLPASLVDPHGSCLTNVALALTACEATRLGFAKRLVHFSSSEVYGSASYVPIDEAHPYNPSTPYAASKLAGDQLVLSYAHTFGIRTLTIRPFNNFGPRQNAGSYAGILPIIANKVRDGEPVEIFGDGLQTRDLIFVTDTVEGVIRLVDCEAAEGLTVNVATGKEVTVNELVTLGLAACGVPKHLVIQRPARPGDVRRHLASGQLAFQLVGFRPQTGLLEGLSETMSFYFEKVAS
jgi:UDP-glucose 4-epimerase